MISPSSSLRAECAVLARNTRQLHYPDWTEAELAGCERFYSDHVGRLVQYLTKAGEDSHIVARAVRYLMRQPVSQDFVSWFRERMALLIELSCPTMPSPICGEPFFHDLCRGMNRANEMGIQHTYVNEYQAVELFEEEIPGRESAVSLS